MLISAPYAPNAELRQTAAHASLLVTGSAHWLQSLPWSVFLASCSLDGRTPQSVLLHILLTTICVQSLSAAEVVWDTGPSVPSMAQHENSSMAQLQL